MGAHPYDPPTTKENPDAAAELELPGKHGPRI